MRHCDDLDVGIALAIDDEVRKTPQRDTAHRRADAHAGHESADRWTFGDQPQALLDLVPELLAEPGSLVLVPGDRVTQLGLRLTVEAQALHLPKISRSIRWRTSLQSELTA